MFEDVVNKIIAEHKHITNNGNFNKFSVIKRKGKNPKYNQQCQQKPPAPADASKPYQSSTSNQQGQKKRGKAAGKKKNQPPYHHTHEAVNDTSDGD